MNRNKVIDSLRFLGVVLVLFRHLIVSGDKSKHFSLLEYAMQSIHGGGWMGVDLFFVLSGFLISGLIFQELNKTRNFKPLNFLVRRGLKIYPAYYILLSLSFIVSMYFDIGFFTLKGFISEFFFIANYTNYFNNGILWSICVEEHFYLFLCIMLYFLSKKEKLNFRNILILYFIILTIAFGSRFYNYQLTGFSEFARDGIKSHQRFEALFFGVILSYIYVNKPLLIKKVLLYYKIILPICILYISLHFIFSQANNNWIIIFSLSINPLCFGYIMIYLLSIDKIEDNFIISITASIGKFSYSIYLFHKLIDDFCLNYFERYYYYFSYLTLSIIIGIVFSKLIEYPILNIRDKYFPSFSKI